MAYYDSSARCYMAMSSRKTGCISKSSTNLFSLVPVSFNQITDFALRHHPTNKIFHDGIWKPTTVTFRIIPGTNCYMTWCRDMRSSWFFTWGYREEHYNLVDQRRQGKHTRCDFPPPPSPLFTSHTPLTSTTPSPATPYSKTRVLCCFSFGVPVCFSLPTHHSCR